MFFLPSLFHTFTVSRYLTSLCSSLISSDVSLSFFCIRWLSHLCLLLFLASSPLLITPSTSAFTIFIALSLSALHPSSLYNFCVYLSFIVVPPWELYSLYSPFVFPILSSMSRIPFRDHTTLRANLYSPYDPYPCPKILIFRITHVS